MPLEKSAGAVVFYREKNGKILYLLLHHEWGHFDFPKGNIEKGEGLKDTAKREIKEETGLKEIEFIPGFKEHIKYFYKLRGKNIFKIVTFFLVQSKTKKVKVSFEHKGYKWLPFEKAIKILKFKNAKELLRKADSFLKVYFRKNL